MKVRLIFRSEVESLLDISEVIDTVEEAFRAKGQGKVQMPPKPYISKKYEGGFLFLRKTFFATPKCIGEKGGQELFEFQLHGSNLLCDCSHLPFISFHDDELDLN